MSFVDRGLPLDALVVGADRGDDDLVLHRQRTEIDGHVPRRTKTLDDFLAVDSHRDARVIEGGNDRQVYRAFDIGRRRGIAPEDELVRSRGCGGGEQESEGECEREMRVTA